MLTVVDGIDDVDAEFTCTDHRHRLFRAVARCRWPSAEWIAGDGPYAVAAYGRPLTIQLYATSEAAANARALIDETGCGHTCTSWHQVYELGMRRDR